MSISGLHCASCAGIIERSLKKVPGVKTSNVNFAAEKASITFDEASTNVDNLLAAVKKAGYQAELIDAKSQNLKLKRGKRK